ncbi:hypothetical protein [Georgenia sp. Marseille-Q6866]
MLDLSSGWQVALEVVGWVGSGIVVWSMMQQRILRLRVYNLVGCLVQVLYNGVLGVWPVVALNVVLAVVQVVNLTRLLRGRDDPDSYSVAEVPARGPLLAQLVDRHREDVARFHPGFTAPTAEADAFVVMSGDEVAGWVVVHDDDGVAQIEVDYVTERFRDLSPGRFVFRRSGVLAERGYRAVAWAPDTVEPYYEQVGFERRGDRYVLDLTP